MNPYKSLPENAFWRSAVASRNMFDIRELWKPKFKVKQDHKIATFGSCFAQHIGRTLKKNGFGWLNTEPPPKGLSADNCQKYNYNTFTCRTGNIYTTSLLRQWIYWAIGNEPVPSEIWEKEGRFFDPFRPNIEPDGFGTREEIFNSRLQTIKSFREAIEQSDIFIFTLGLTESWFNRNEEYEYPVCPGVIAGEYDKERHKFVNQDFLQVKENLESSIQMMRNVNRDLEVILTVSPVPLTASNSGNHVLLATIESKSILRAVASQLTSNVPFVDYFPSYEIISSPPFRGTFFEPNLRTINPVGVNFVMKNFFDGLNLNFKETSFQESVKKDKSLSVEDVICEEELLSAFNQL